MEELCSLKNEFEKSRTVLQEKIIQNKNGNIEMLIQAWTSLQELMIGNFDLLLSNIPENYKVEVVAQQSKSDQVYEHILTLLKTLMVNSIKTDRTQADEQRSYDGVYDIITSMKNLSLQCSNKESPIEFAVTQKDHDTSSHKELKADKKTQDLIVEDSNLQGSLNESSEDLNATKGDNETSCSKELKTVESETPCLSSTDENSNLGCSSIQFSEDLADASGSKNPLTVVVRTPIGKLEAWELEAAQLKSLDSSSTEEESNPELCSSSESETSNASSTDEESSSKCEPKDPWANILAEVNKMKQQQQELKPDCSPLLTVSVPTCPECKARSSHFIKNCPSFRNAPNHERWIIAQRRRLCYKCLLPGHLFHSCTSTTSCKFCIVAHHTMLHWSPVDEENTGKQDPDICRECYGNHPINLCRTLLTAGAAKRFLLIYLHKLCVECLFPDHTGSPCPSVSKGKTYWWKDTPIFVSGTVSERWGIVRAHRLCFNCLLPGHAHYYCPSGLYCLKCKSLHNTMLHEDTEESQLIISRKIHNDLETEEDESVQIDHYSDDDSDTSSIPDIDSFIIFPHLDHKCDPDVCTGVSEANSIDHGDNHPMWRCPVFLEANVKERRALVQRGHVCYNCLSPYHTLKNCTSSSSCKKCGKRHNTLIHQEKVIGWSEQMSKLMASIMSSLERRTIEQQK